MRAITGRIDLVHANNSRDAFDSGADRHANIESGQIEAELIAEVCRAAGSDVVVETPGGAEGQGADDLRISARASRGTSRRSAVELPAGRVVHAACPHHVQLRVPHLAHDQRGNHQQQHVAAAITTTSVE